MIVGLLLAAGGARRFGSQKLVAPLDGVPIVRRAFDSLAATTDAGLVVVGSESEAVARGQQRLSAAELTPPAARASASRAPRRR